MIVVGMVSSYREGRLVRGAVESLREVGLDRLYIFEGPAGEPLDDPAVPESELGDYDPVAGETTIEHSLKSRGRPIIVHRGRWRTDGRKRNEMLQRCKQDFPGVPVWAVVVDGDELLVNGRYLRDRLQWVLWEDERKGASIATPANPPMARWPLHLLEHDGSMAVITARVFRADLLRSIDISSSVVTNASGIREGWGNFEAVSRAWIEGWLAAIDAGKMIAWPPGQTEPHLVHRSNLRHPGRRGLRMSEQEAELFAEAQRLESAGVDHELEGLLELDRRHAAGEL